MNVWILKKRLTEYIAENEQAAANLHQEKRFLASGARWGVVEGAKAALRMVNDANYEQRRGTKDKVKE